jgi:hypothetical protein
MGSVKGDGGHVVSILSEDDADKMEDLAQELGFDFVDLEPLSEAYSRSTDEVLDDDADIIVEDVEEARRILEDTITLLSLAEDVDIEHDGIAGNDSSKGSQEVLNNENEREEEEGFQ